MDDESLSEEDPFIEYQQRFEPHPYHAAFCLMPNESSGLESPHPDAFYEAAALLIDEIVAGRVNESEASPALFLCRHYLELELKFILFHSRWLKGPDVNARDNEIEAVRGKQFNHNLEKVWRTLRSELEKKKIQLAALDLAFVDNFIAEFHKHDQGSQKFRYPGTELPARSSHLNFAIDFTLLQGNLDRTHDILQSLDSNLIETHGLNDEWEQEVSSW